MRLRLSLLIVFYILSSVLDSSAKGQDSIQSSEFNFKSNIKLEAFRGGFQYERRLMDKSSVGLTLGFDVRYFGNPDAFDFQITPEYRYYLSRQKAWPLALYIGSYLFYKDFIVARDMESNGSLIYSKDEIRTSGFGFKIGYQYGFTRTKRFVFDVNFGLGYNIWRDVKNTEGIPIIDEDTYYFNFSGSIAFGYIF